MTTQRQGVPARTLVSLEPAAAATAWLERLECLLVEHEPRSLADVADLFAPDSHWRDSLAVTGALRTVSGNLQIAHALHRYPGAGSRFRLATARTPPRFVRRAGVLVIEAIFAFDGAYGPGSGVLRLADAKDHAPTAWILHTSLDGLTALPEIDYPELHPARTFGSRNWAERRRDYQQYDGHDPVVVVIGAGHAGLATAASLTRLGIETLVVDRLPRVGDIWRNRYDSLVLHNETHVDHMPYLPFPTSSPRFQPRDMVADWLKAYATVLNLNVWTDTELIGATPVDKGWSVVLRRGGQARELRPQHLVMAVGTNSTPLPPCEPGLDDFKGTVMHSGNYRSGRAYAGKRAVVLGTGSSAHDIAQDLHGYGAHVTMVQRGPTLVVSLAEAQKVYAFHDEGLPLADADLLSAATPYPVLVKANQINAAAARAADHELLHRLAAKGFRLDDGAPDATGFQLRLLRRGGGYYVNVGCSELIADGVIDLIQADRIDRFDAGGIRLTDGSHLPADLVIAGIGYLRQHDVLRHLLGEQVAARVGAIGGFDEHGEQRNLWQQTRQPGLWFTGGGFPQTRAGSRLLALQIAMSEVGVLPPLGT